MALPPYISDRGHGEISFSVPLKISGVTSWGFLLKADAATLQAFVDEQLNQVSGGAVTYSVVSILGQAYLFHAWLNAQHCTSTSEVIGWLPDREAAFLVPLLQHRAGQILPQLKMWVPYLLIDQQSGMVTGREVWGYRKSLATINVPAQPAGATGFSADTTIFRRFSPDTQGEVATLLRVTSITTVSAPSTWGSVQAAVNEILDKLGDAGFAIAQMAGQALAQFFGEPRLNVINLKQFRDAVDSTRACYQALVQSPCRLDDWHGGGLLHGDYRIEITTCDSHQIARDLGLGVPPSNGPLIVKPRLAWWVRMGFSTEPGKVIWPPQP
jgi:hypothetical protein